MSWDACADFHTLSFGSYILYVLSHLCWLQHSESNTRVFLQELILHLIAYFHGKHPSVRYFTTMTSSSLILSVYH